MSVHGTAGQSKKNLTIVEIVEQTETGCVCAKARQLSRLVTTCYDNAFRSLGITAAQFTLITQIAARDGITAATIAVTLGIQKSTLSRNLKRLRQLELLTAGKRTRRSGQGLYITPAGLAMIERAYPAWNVTQEKVVSVLGSGTEHLLDELIARMEDI